MKPIRRSSMALLLAAVLATAVTAQTKPPTAEQVLTGATQTAKAEQKNVLIHFGASWCSWCRHLDAMLESAEVGKLFQDNYVIAHLTIQESKDKVALENPGAQEMVDGAGAKGAGVPVYIFFDSDGQVASQHRWRCPTAAISAIRQRLKRSWHSPDCSKRRLRA